MNRRSFVAALGVLPFAGSLASDDVITVKPGESVRSPWVPLKRTGAGRYSAATPFPLRGDPRIAPGMMLMIGTSPAQSIMMRVSGDGKTWVRA